MPLGKENAVGREDGNGGDSMSVPGRRKIDLASYPRRGLLKAFRDRQMPCFSTTCNVNISTLRRVAQQNRQNFFITMSFAISRAVNCIPEFRQRLIQRELYEFERVDPGYTVQLADGTFSFCDSRYWEDFDTYYAYASNRIEAVKRSPDHSTHEKHHMFFITSIPWFSFTSFTHPYDEKYGSIPIITLGKYFDQGDEIVMPMAVQVHHGIIDGIHVARFFDTLSDIVSNPTLYTP